MPASLRVALAAGLTLLLASSVVEASAAAPAKSGAVHRHGAHKGRARLRAMPPSVRTTAPPALPRTAPGTIAAPKVPSGDPCPSGPCGGGLGKPVPPFYGVGPYPGPAFNPNMPGSWRPPVIAVPQIR